MKSRKNTIATQIKQIYHNLLSKYLKRVKESVYGKKLFFLLQRISIIIIVSRIDIEPRIIVI